MTGRPLRQLQLVRGERNLSRNCCAVRPVAQALVPQAGLLSLLQKLNESPNHAADHTRTRQGANAPHDDHPASPGSLLARLPDAELKIFVTASPEIRAQRRYDELRAKGEEAGFDEILENVKQRDYIDQHRDVSPLRKADDALLLDNTDLTIAQQKEWLFDQFNKVTN